MQSHSSRRYHIDGLVYKTAVSTLLTHRRYCSLALSHRYIVVDLMEFYHYGDVTMSTMASQITCVSMFTGRLFRRRSEKASKLCVTGLCERNPPVTGGFPSQKARNAENVSIGWHHHETCCMYPVVASLWRNVSSWGIPVGRISF